MSSAKYLIAMVFLVVAVMATNVVPPRAEIYARPANKTHSMIVGYRVPGDRLVLRQSVVKPSAWMKVQVVQKMFNVSRYETITQLRALDQKTNGKGAFVSLVNGGPGYKNVTLKFKSQRNHSIDYVVELYAR